MPQLFGRRRVPEDVEAVATMEHDARLMLQVRAGDETSFALLLDRHRAPVIRYMYRMVQDQGAAEELAQEVFLRVYKSREKYEPTAKFTTWLYRIATHLALNAIRDGKHERREVRLDEQPEDAPVKQVPDRAPTVEQDLVRETRVAEIRAAIQALPDKQRAAVLMHKYEGFDYASIARTLECTEPAVKSLLFRAYETLRARLSHMNQGFRA